MKVKGNHPLAEIIAKALFGIEQDFPVSKEQNKKIKMRMINRACKEAVNWYENHQMNNLQMISQYFALIDGAYDIIELWDAKSVGQKEWKENWLKEAEKLGAD